jgi:hypothetical protein
MFVRAEVLKMIQQIFIASHNTYDLISTDFDIS